MNATLSLPPGDDIDTSMRLVARNVAMGIYPLQKILEMCNVKLIDFNRWKEHPRFTAYVKTEAEAWNAAHNTSERTKLKAAIIMEEWLPDAYAEMKNGKQGLNHRVELAKLVTKIAGLEPSSSNGFGAGGGGGGGFSLQINIAPGRTTVIAQPQQFEEAEVIEEQPIRRIKEAIPTLPELDFDEDEDDTALFTSPDTLEGF